MNNDKILDKIKHFQDLRKKTSSGPEIHLLTEKIRSLFRKMNDEKNVGAVLKTENRGSLFAVWLRSQLTEMDISTQVLADLCGCGRVTISHWINGHSIPHTKAWNELARIISDRTGKPLSTVLEKMSQTI